MAKLETRYEVGSVEELRQKGRIIATVKGMELGIFAVGDDYYAWRNLCPHGGAPVCEGVVCGTRLPSLVYEYKYGKDREILRCPWHGWEFDLLTGQHLVNDKVKLRGYGVVEEDGQLYVVV
ncbi:Rieske 2Fe-2S domain-containing protein [Paenibacillus sp. HB172176]|uniref:Rieske (2Fe-2S) protein n=1 Tax=Paenibacillus sp. HB172176 TaxID=2493690 RepID=UPI001F0F05AE|nr:Rieske 2Fe-2S domain-containing protein [Paenibacillus sp. HB172176]